MLSVVFVLPSSMWAMIPMFWVLFLFSSRRRHTRWNCDWSSDVCSSDLAAIRANHAAIATGEDQQWHQVGGQVAVSEARLEREQVPIGMGAFGRRQGAVLP